MNRFDKKQGIWFVYDGECPLCARAALALRIKAEYGSLSLLNARESHSDPLVLEINRRGLDLDEGMVIYTQSQFYHGAEVLGFMARYGESKNPFMVAVKSLFWSSTIAKLLYPWMRGVRNWLIKRKKVGRIDNLKESQQPIFQSVFGASWDYLPPVMKKHYANHPYSQEVNLVKGRLDVYCKPPLLWIAPLMNWMGQVPAYNETDAEVTVRFESDLHSKSFCFNREFVFTNGQQYRFRSCMLPIGKDELIEIMRFGLGWKLRIDWTGEKVVLKHRGYALSVFGHLIPLPLTFLMGAGYAEEIPVDDKTFDMEVYIDHPWWGRVYGYKGRFEIVE